jgi:hypothetical protein
MSDKLVDAMTKNVWLGFFLLGGVLMLGAFAEKAGPVTFSSSSFRWVLAPVGVVLIGVALWLLLRYRREMGVLGEGAFWKKAFEGLPPAFVKEYSDVAFREKHIFDNEALRAIQGVFEEGDTQDTRLERVRIDHARGDRLSVGGSSRQIESCDLAGGRAPRAIYTAKKGFDHEGRRFIVGWYLPVDLDKQEREAEDIKLKSVCGLPVFQLTLARDGADALDVAVGESVKTNLVTGMSY